MNDFFFKQVLFVVSMKECTLETELVLLNKLLSVPYKEKKKEEWGTGLSRSLPPLQNCRILKFAYNYVFILPLSTSCHRYLQGAEHAFIINSYLYAKH